MLNIIKVILQNHDPLWKPTCPTLELSMKSGSPSSSAATEPLWMTKDSWPTDNSAECQTPGQFCLLWTFSNVYTFPLSTRPSLLNVWALLNTPTQWWHYSRGHLRGLPLVPINHPHPLLLIDSDATPMQYLIQPVWVARPGGLNDVCTHLGGSLQGPTSYIYLHNFFCIPTVSPATEYFMNVECQWYNTPLVRWATATPLHATKEAVWPCSHSIEGRLAQTWTEQRSTLTWYGLEKAGYVDNVPPWRRQLQSPGSSPYGEKEVIIFNYFQHQGLSLSIVSLDGHMDTTLLCVHVCLRQNEMAVSRDMTGHVSAHLPAAHQQWVQRFILRHMERKQEPSIYE